MAHDNCIDLWQLMYDTNLGGFADRANAAKARREHTEAVFRSGTPFPITKLLFELIDEILGHLNRKPDLVACCLVSKALLPHARRALYASVELEFIEDADYRDSRFLPPDQNSLFRTLTGSFDLATLVKSVVFGLEDNKYAYWTAQKCGIEFSADTDELELEEYRLPEEWVEENKVDMPGLIRQILEKLPNLRHLELDLGPLGLDCLSGVVLSSVTSMKAFLLSPALLSACPSLSYLNVGVPADFESVDYSPPPSLQRLTAALRPGTKPYNVDKIVGFYSFLLGNSSSTLERLDLPFHPVFDFSFASFSSLRILRLDFVYGNDTKGGACPFFSTLQTLPLPLGTLEINDSTRAKGEPVLVGETYLAHLPSHLTKLSLSAGAFFPATVFAFLEQIDEHLPHLKQLDWTRFAVCFEGTSIPPMWCEPWDPKDQDEVYRLCDAKGLKGSVRQ